MSFAYRLFQQITLSGLALLCDNVTDDKLGNFSLSPEQSFNIVTFVSPIANYMLSSHVQSCHKPIVMFWSKAHSLQLKLTESFVITNKHQHCMFSHFPYSICFLGEIQLYILSISKQHVSLSLRDITFNIISNLSWSLLTLLILLSCKPLSMRFKMDAKTAMSKLGQLTLEVDV